MEYIIVYLLALLFFLALPIVVLLVIQDPKAPEGSQSYDETGALVGDGQRRTSARNSSISGTIAYGFIAVLLALFVVLTVMTNRARS